MRADVKSKIQQFCDSQLPRTTPMSDASNGLQFVRRVSMNGITDLLNFPHTQLVEKK